MRAIAATSKILPLIKPQFEAGRSGLGKRGIVRDPEIHRRVLEEIVEFAASLGLGLHGLMRSEVAGPKGNVEFPVWFAPIPGPLPPQELIEGALVEETSS